VARAASPTDLPMRMRRLSPLVGAWNVTLRWSEETHRLIGGPREVEARATIRWLRQGAVLHFRMGPSHWFIGGDESSGQYCVLYTDDRPTSRVYRMSFARGVWRIWRDAPGFRQRFEGRVDEGGRRIEAHWDKAEGRRAWVRDFDMTFVRSARAP
jgi:hypothetical protein